MSFLNRRATTPTSSVRQRNLPATGRTLTPAPRLGSSSSSSSLGSAGRSKFAIPRASMRGTPSPSFRSHSAVSGKTPGATPAAAAAASGGDPRTTSTARTPSGTRTAGNRNASGALTPPLRHELFVSGDTSSGDPFAIADALAGAARASRAANGGCRPDGRRSSIRLSPIRHRTRESAAHHGALGSKSDAGCTTVREEPLTEQVTEAKAGTAEQTKGLSSGQLIEGSSTPIPPRLRSMRSARRTQPCEDQKAVDSENEIETGNEKRASTESLHSETLLALGGAPHDGRASFGGRVVDDPCSVTVFGFPRSCAADVRRRFEALAPTDAGRAMMDASSRRPQLNHLRVRYREEQGAQAALVFDGQWVNLGGQPFVVGVKHSDLVDAMPRKSTSLTASCGAEIQTEENREADGEFPQASRGGLQIVAVKRSWFWQIHYFFMQGW